MDKQEFMEYLEEEYECQVKLWNCDSSDRLQIGKVNLLEEIIDKAKGLDESEKPEIPRWLAERIEEYYIDSSIEFWRYFFNGDIFNPINGERAWILNNDDIINKIFLCGYTIQNQPAWVIKTFAGYLTKFETFVNNNWRAKISSSKDDKDIITFECKEKANEIAELIGGLVKEWSE